MEKNSIDLYTLNKAIVAQAPPITNKQLEAGKQAIRSLALQSGYLMLLCQDLRYYTVFKIDPSGKEKVEDVVIECVESLEGQVVSFGTSEEGSVEIWIKIKDEAYAMYLFNYDKGVEKCRV